MDERMDIDTSTLPSACGVYLFKDASGSVLYVGKAIDIRSRIRSHLQNRDDPKEAMLREHALTVDWILTSNELEALVLEDTLIKKHQPRYNIRLKDDKSYPYILVTREEYPSVRHVRGLHPGSGDHFGPHGDPLAVRRSMRWLRKVFPVRSCSRDMSRRSRPCLEHHIGRCLAPCAGIVDKDAYTMAVRGIREFLSGRGESLLGELNDLMWRASSEGAYERAALMRDIIKGLERMLEGQKAVLQGSSDVDLISFSKDRTAASVLIVRGGRMMDAVKFTLEGSEPIGGPSEDFLTSYYSIAGSLPERIVLDRTDLEGSWREDMEQFLSAKRGRPVRIRRPRGDDQRHLLAVSRSNAEEKARSVVRALEGPNSLVRLKEALDLEVLPQVIECFDISHLGGTNTVAAMAQFRSGRPAKSGYRRFRISREVNDDHLSMKEAVTRRYRRLLDHGDPLPDLILIDGGKGQLGSALDALSDVGVADTIPVAALAKKEETIYRSGSALPLVLRRDDPALKLLQRIRDEAHRFAVTYQRSTRRIDESILMEVQGIGKKRYLAISREFDSLDALLEAGPAEVARRCSLPSDLAERMLAHIISTKVRPATGHENSVSKP